MSNDADADDLKAHRARNTVQALAVIGVTSALVSASAYLAWGSAAGFAAIAIVGGVALLATSLPAEQVMRFYHARPVPPDDSQLSSLVDVLAYRTGLKQRPALYIIPSLTETAFTAGTAAAPAIAVTEGLLRKLSLRETAGVLAHEFGHIYYDDLETLTFADVMSRLLLALSYVALALALVNLYAESFGPPLVPWAALALLYAAPAVGNGVQYLLSRDREYAADRAALALTGDMEGLRAGLAKMPSASGQMWEDLMFPVPVRRIPEPSLLRSHPPADVRIARIAEAEGQPTAERLVIAEQPMISLVGYGPLSMKPRYRWPGIWY